jgi:hypothetical protein
VNFIRLFCFAKQSSDVSVRAFSDSHISSEQLLPEAIQLRMKYNRAQTFWPPRVLYRFFVTRHRVANKNIAQQFP